MAGIKLGDREVKRAVAGEAPRVAEDEGAVAWPGAGVYDQRATFADDDPDVRDERDPVVRDHEDGADTSPGSPRTSGGR